MPDSTPAPAAAPTTSVAGDVTTLAGDSLALLKDVAALSAEVHTLDIPGAIATVKDLLGKAREGLAALKDLVSQLQALKTSL
jgi:hypothetical protein